MNVLLGIDIGGTFTDFLVSSDSGLEVHKRASTPDDPARAVLEGIDALGVTPRLVIHGSTVATNTVLERRGARTALVTTEGMKDILLIGRQIRADIYDLQPMTPEPLVPPELSFELHARLRPDGSVEKEARESEVQALVEQAREQKVEALAVALLYSYANPAMEELFENVVGASENDRHLYLSLSSHVSPEYREVERTASTVLNAYVGPVMSRYLNRLSEGLEQRGTERLHILQSDGGSADAALAARLPVSTLLSGPAAGVTGAFAIAKQAGYDRIITLDMGGTSTDVALCDQTLPMRTDITIGEFSARTPVVDVHTVGAGGGSIARIDSGGALQVGPQSAGADPGPACYGRGQGFTVTDAQLILGRLRSGDLLGGTIPLDEQKASQAATNVARSFGGDQLGAAQAVIDVATANMERALRVVSVQRGHDPRDFTLVAFGGAGPLHACSLAEALEMRSILVPAMPGVLAALGAVRSDLSATQARSVLVPLNVDSLTTVNAALQEVRREVRSRLDSPDAQLTLALDLRYVGQSYELTVEIRGPESDADYIQTARTEFDSLHEERFAHHDSDATVEVVNVRATARIRGPDVDVTPKLSPGDDNRSTTELWIAGTWQPASCYQRLSLKPNQSFEGPAVVTQLDSTTLIAPGWGATVDKFGNLLMERS